MYAASPLGSRNDFSGMCGSLVSDQRARREAEARPSEGAPADRLPKPAAGLRQGLRLLELAARIQVLDKAMDVPIEAAIDQAAIDAHAANGRRHTRDQSLVARLVDREEPR